MVLQVALHPIVLGFVVFFPVLFLFLEGLFLCLLEVLNELFGCLFLLDSGFFDGGVYLLVLLLGSVDAWVKVWVPC